MDVTLEKRVEDLEKAVCELSYLLLRAYDGKDRYAIARSLEDIRYLVKGAYR